MQWGALVAVELVPMYRMVHAHLHDLIEAIETGAGDDCHSIACTDDFLSIIPIPDGVTEQTMSEGVICKSLDLMNGEGRTMTGVSQLRGKQDEDLHSEHNGPRQV